MKPEWFMQGYHTHSLLSLVAKSYPKTAELRLAKIHIFCTQETWQCAGIVHARLPGLGERLPVLFKVRHDMWGL